MSKQQAPSPKETRLLERKEWQNFIVRLFDFDGEEFPC